MLPSLTILICCHNSARRLAPTLQHLLAQHTAAGLRWEVLVIDNASTDDTAAVARRLWPESAPAPLRVVHEPRRGLLHARLRGLAAATTDLISFVDDDNWLGPDWIQRVAELMAAHPEVGACGGYNEPVLDGPAPTWFGALQQNFAVGPQAARLGDVTHSAGRLFGAGLTVRRAAWQGLMDGGYRPLLSGRTGRQLISGEDYELCFALRLAGWKLHYRADLRMKHHIETSRLRWPYVRRLYRGHGVTSLGFDAYEFTGDPPFDKPWDYPSRDLWRNALRQAWDRLAFHWRQSRRLWPSAAVGDINGLYFQYQLGRLLGLLRLRHRYDANLHAVHGAAWRYDATAPGSVGAQPVVTALICNYNYGRYLPDAIESALRQTYRPLEIVVVDDGSTDDSREILARYGDRIRVVHKPNGGQASAFNAGIAVATGEIICFLDSDDRWQPEKVAAVVAKFRDGPWGMVCHELEDVDADGVPIPPDTPGFRFTYELRQGQLLDTVESEGYPWLFSPTSGLSLRADVARRLLPLPEQGWRVCADNLLAYGAICHGPVGVIRSRLAQYRYHDGNGYAVLREVKDERELTWEVLRAKSYWYLRDHLARLGRRSRGEPKIQYRFYRVCCLATRERPLRDLPELWRRNLAFDRGRGALFQVVDTLRYLVVDVFAALAVTLGVSARYRKVRERFDRLAATLDARTLRYLTSDEPLAAAEAPPS